MNDVAVSGPPRSWPLRFTLVGLGVFQVLNFLTQFVKEFFSDITGTYSDWWGVFTFPGEPLSQYLATFLLGIWLIFSGLCLRQFIRYVPGLVNGLFLVVAWQIFAFGLFEMKQGNKEGFIAHFGVGLFVLVLMTLVWVYQAKDSASMNPEDHKTFFSIFLWYLKGLLALGAWHLGWFAGPALIDMAGNLTHSQKLAEIGFTFGLLTICFGVLMLLVLFFFFGGLARKRPAWLMGILAAATTCTGMGFSTLYIFSRSGSFEIGIGSLWFLVVYYLPLFITLRAVQKGKFPKQQVFGGW